MPAGKKRTFYVLAGSNTCGPNDNGGHWCGYGKGTPQSLLFSSDDLVNWTFKSVFWRGPFTGLRGKPLNSHGSLYTPDTFELPVRNIVNFVLHTRNCVSKSHKNEGLCIKITQKRGILH